MGIEQLARRVETLSINFSLYLSLSLCVCVCVCVRNLGRSTYLRNFVCADLFTSIADEFELAESNGGVLLIDSPSIPIGQQITIHAAEALRLFFIRALYNRS